MTTTFTKSTRVPAYRKLANAITEHILDGRMKEGDSLPTETVLSEMFGVNRHTVREGIRVLEEANLIRRENSSKKMYISRPSHQETGANIERAVIMHEVTFAELWEAILAIEPTIARFAAEKCDELILAQMELNLEKTKMAIKKGESLFALDTEFHALILKMSANMVLNFTRGPIASIFNSACEKVMKDGSLPTKQLLESHQAIFKAIRSKNADKAESCMRKHVQDFVNWMKLMGVNIDGGSFRVRPAKLI